MEGHYGRYHSTGQSTHETYHAVVGLPDGDFDAVEVGGLNYTAETAALVAVLELTEGRSSDYEVESAADQYKENGRWKQFLVNDKKTGGVTRVAVIHTNTRHF